MRRFPLLMLLLAGCSSHPHSVPAGPTAGSCAQEAVRSLGYTIRGDASGAISSFTAEKQLPREVRGPVIGEIRVSLHGSDDSSMYLLVDGRRYLVTSGSARPPARDPCRGWLAARRRPPGSADRRGRLRAARAATRAGGRGCGSGA